MNRTSGKQLSQSHALRYSRQILLADFDIERQEILLNARVLQFGVGGLGCASAQYLVAAGIGHITLIDDDKVAVTNLQRQVLHYEDDLGRLKCDSAKQTLLQMNSALSINTIASRLNQIELTEQVSKHDIVLDCTDNLASRKLINQACFALDKPLVSGAAIRMEGQVASFKAGQSQPCYQCLSDLFGEQTLSCMESGVMSPVVGIVGATQALETIKLLTSYGSSSLGRLQVFDAMSGCWTNYNIVKNIDCKVCSNQIGRSHSN